MTTRERITYDENGNVVETQTYDVPAEEENEEAIRSAARQAIASNRAYIALANPTAAQNVAQTKSLSRQMNGVLRLVLGQFDGVD